MKVQITQGRQSGQVVDVNAAEGEGMIASGFGVAVPDVPVAAEVTEPARPAIVAIGGGWYQLADGTRVRGKASAERLAAG